MMILNICLLFTDIPRPFFSKSRVKPNRNNFKLIADSVQGLRSFLNELNIEDSVVPDSLINALEDLIAKSEPLEYNLIDINNNSKIKLFKDWKSYSERLEIERDETVFWEEKEIKQTTLGNIHDLCLFIEYNQLMNYIMYRLNQKFSI